VTLLSRNSTSTAEPNVAYPALVSAENLADYFGIRRSRIYEMVADGTLPPPIRLRTRIRWQNETLSRFLNIEGLIPANVEASTGGDA
jgi:predicted DNA-binding transcriptional regulator AlpA